MDIERAQELKASMLWGSVVEEIDKKIYFEVCKLKACKPYELIFIQAKIECFESLKKLPDDVIEREE